MDNANNIIYQKNNIIIKKGLSETLIKKYQMLFSLENRHISLQKLINFSMVDLFYAANKEFFEDYTITMHNENEATIYFLLKHFLKDLGMPQKYIYVTVQIEKLCETMIQFKAQTINNILPPNLRKDTSNDVDLLLLNDISVDFSIKNANNVDFSASIELQSKNEVLEFVEQFSIKILSKMFLRIKQLIENYK
jgi:hypothetical protein